MLTNNLIGIMYACSWLAPAVGNVFSLILISCFQFTDARLDVGTQETVLSAVVTEVYTYAAAAVAIFLTIWNCYSHEYMMRKLFYNQIIQRLVFIIL